MLDKEIKTAIMPILIDIMKDRANRSSCGGLSRPSALPSAHPGLVKTCGSAATAASAPRWCATG